MPCFPLAYNYVVSTEPNTWKKFEEPNKEWASEADELVNEVTDTHTETDHFPPYTEPEPQPNQNQDSPHQPTEYGSAKPLGLTDDECDDIPDDVSDEEIE